MTRMLLAMLLAASPALAQTTTPPLTPAAGNPNLAVASVRMDNGIRASKLIGSGVYADANTQLGTVDDLIMTQDHRVVFAVVGVGGVLGVGSKLVAIPIGQLQPGNDGHLMLPGATKDSLTAMPNFVY